VSDATQTPWAVHLPSQGDGGAGPHDRVIVGRICEPSDDDEGGTCVVVAHVKGSPTAGGIPAANADLIVRAVNSHAAMLAELVDVAASLELHAELLDRWAAESRSGGWSTHQVDAQRQKADTFRKQAAQVRRTIAKATGKES
jgi:hypothetical protein